MFISVLLANLIGAACVTAAVEIGGVKIRWRTLLRLMLTSVVAAPIANASLALGATVLLWSQPAAVWLLAAIAVVLVFAYRGYAALSGRYSNLQLLYDFTRAVEHSTERQTALQSLLSSTRQLLRAEVAELLLVADGEGLTVVHSELGGDNVVKTATYGSVGVAGPFWERAIRSERGIRVPSKTRDKALRADLADHGRRDYMVVPLRRKGRVVGAMAVGDRWGDASTFKDDDLHFFEALANHAAVSLENVSLFNRLEHAAWHDELTGLANRGSFNQRITEALDQRARGTKVALLLMDLDRFKEVNDTLGHHQGDRVLVGVALRLGRVLRSRAVLARLGGDEFGVLLTDIVDDAEPVRVADRLRRVLGEPFVLGDLSVTIGATIGIAVCPDHGDDASTLLQRADVAMYTAKGGEGVATYSTGTDNYSPRRLALVGELRTAIDHDQLELYYQPQANLETGEVVGAEALLRWRHPLAGFVAPQEFVEVAERSDLIRPLTLFVLRSATTQWRKWKNTGVDVAISVNLSVRNLVDPNLMDDLARAPPRVRHAALASDPRDHREHHHVRPDPFRRRGTGPRRGPDLDRRLRDRVLLARLSDPAAGRGGQDRPVVRAEHGDRRQRPGHRSRRDRPRRQPRAQGHRRGSRDASGMGHAGRARLPGRPGLSAQPSAARPAVLHLGVRTQGRLPGSTGAVPPRRIIGVTGGPSEPGRRRELNHGAPGVVVPNHQIG